MAENFLNNSSLNPNLNKQFGMNVLPERTIQQVKDSAVNLMKDIVKPITELGLGKENIFDGTVAQKIKTYQNVINAVNINSARIDPKSYRTLDIQS